MLSLLVSKGRIWHFPSLGEKTNLSESGSVLIESIRRQKPLTVGKVLWNTSKNGNDVDYRKQKSKTCSKEA